MTSFENTPLQKGNHRPFALVVNFSPAFSDVLSYALTLSDYQAVILRSERDAVSLLSTTFQHHHSPAALFLHLADQRQDGLYLSCWMQRQQAEQGRCWPFPVLALAFEPARWDTQFLGIDRIIEMPGLYEVREALRQNRTLR